MYVKAIMTGLNDLTIAYPETLVREAVRVILSKGLTGLPVVDKKGLFLGEISLRDIIREALPRYVTNGNLKDVSFAPGLFKFDEKVDEMLSKEVVAVMRRGVRTVTSEMSTFEVSTILSISENRGESVYVVEKDGRLAGAVFMASIFLRLVK